MPSLLDGAEYWHAGVQSRCREVVCALQRGARRGWLDHGLIEGMVRVHYGDGDGGPLAFEWTVEVQRLSLPAAGSNRTHNPGFVSSPLGHRLDPARVDAMVTSAGDLGQQCVWSYRPWAVTFEGQGGGG